MEIYCMANYFCKFFNKTVRKHSFQVSDGKRYRNKPNRMSDAEVITVLVAFHIGEYRYLKQFYLGRVRVQSLDASLPKNHVIQQVRGVGTRGGRAVAGLRQAGAAGQVHGYQLRRPHTHARLPRLAHPWPQGVQGHCRERQIFHGMVLRLQDAPHHQRERQDVQFHDYFRKCR